MDDIQNITFKKIPNKDQKFNQKEYYEDNFEKINTDLIPSVNAQLNENKKGIFSTEVQDNYTQSNGYIKSSDFSISAGDVNYVYTPFIPMEAGETINFELRGQPQVYNIVFYNAAQVPISGVVSPHANYNTKYIGSIVAPANTAFVRYCWAERYRSGSQTFGDAKIVLNTNLIKKTNQIESDLANIVAELPPAPKLLLPSKVYALVGKEFNIYYQNIFTDRIENYDVDVTCTIGNQLNKRYTVIPLVAGTYPLTINIYKDNVKIATAVTNLIVKAITVGSAVNKKFILIGDSTTQDGTVTQELMNLFGAVDDPMSITLLGSRGISPNLNEGRSGWRAYDYINSATTGSINNAFWNPATSKFDFAYYMAQQGYAGVDVVGIHLGINDILPAQSDTWANTQINGIVSCYNEMIASIKSFNPSIKIALMITIPPAYNQDAFGKAYKNSYVRWRYFRSYLALAERLISEYDAREAESLYVIPINAALDTENNMQTETVAVNSRSTKQVTIQKDPVHPAPEGYRQIADPIYYWLKGQET